MILDRRTVRGLGRLLLLVVALGLLLARPGLGLDLLARLGRAGLGLGRGTLALLARLGVLVVVILLVELVAAL